MAAERAVFAMGTDVNVILVGPAKLADAAVDRIRDLEARWSRFLPSSEVSALNARAGQPTAVSPETITLVTRAVDAWQLSAGFVDCTELVALIDAGYDTSFDQLEPERRLPAPPHRARNLVGPADIVIDGTTVTLPPGVGFDPGGIGKGLAADIVAAELIADGADGVCIDVGGDLRVDGIPPDGDGWTIAIEHPHADVPLALVGLRSGGVASSTTLKRRWMVNGEQRHHLIDPRTGRPSDTDVAFATAIASEAWRAEALAKAVLLRGGDHPFDIVDGTGDEALTVDYDGSIRTSAGFSRFTGGAVVAPVSARATAGAR